MKASPALPPDELLLDEPPPRLPDPDEVFATARDELPPLDLLVPDLLVADFAIADLLETICSLNSPPPQGIRAADQDSTVSGSTRTSSVPSVT